MTSDDAVPPGEPRAVESLRRLGWSDDVARRWRDAVDDERLVPGRVTRTDRGEVDVATGVGEVRATTTTAAKDTVAGDWVALAPDEGRVEAVLERSSAFVRRAARGAHRPQTLAANMDVVAAVAACDPGVNPRRLEREVVLAFQSEARPLVVVTKADLVDDLDGIRSTARHSAPGVDVVMVSNRTGEGIDELRRLLPPGTTVAFLGASGVGKSSIVNSLAGERVQLEGEVRAGDAKGRHTTTTARLIGVGELLVIDTPGTRALAVWDVEPGIDLAFPEITALGDDCKFADCSHRDEPGCAVRAAAEAGEVDPERLAHWNQLLDEVTELHRPEY